MSNKDYEIKNRELQPYHGFVNNNYNNSLEENKHNYDLVENNHNNGLVDGNNNNSFEESGNIEDQYNQEYDSRKVYEARIENEYKAKVELKYKRRKKILIRTFVLLSVAAFLFWSYDGRPRIFDFFLSFFSKVPSFSENYKKNNPVPSDILSYIDYNEFEKALLSSDLDTINKTSLFLKNKKKEIKDFYIAMKKSLTKDESRDTSLKFDELKKYEYDFKINEFAIDYRLSRLEKRRSKLESSLEIKNINNFKKLSEAELINEVDYFVIGKFIYYDAEIKTTKEHVIDELVSISVRENYVRLLNEVLTKIVDKLHNINTYYRYALTALQSNHMDCFEAFMKHGLDIRERGMSDYLIHIAAWQGNVKIAKYLLDAGIPINQRNSRKETALIVAINNNKYEMMKYLLSEGANPNLQDKYGNTALHYVAKSSSNKEMINIFNRYRDKLDFTVKNNEWKTPREVGKSDCFIDFK